jgi:hypothetical protein
MWTALCLSALTFVGGDETIDFNRDVRPVLAQSCFPCHGFDASTRKAKLRLDRAEFATAERNGLRPIVPGDPAASEVWLRIDAADPADRMPPPDSHRTLSDDDKATLRAWIEQGAPYAEHWAFVAPVRPVPPAADVHPIDAFVREQLAEEGLEPSRPADPRMLVRRLFLDLVGVPPSAEEVEAFAADPSPAAYAALVERLLADPHHGERLALPWLDAARYADTNGFSIDGGRHAWPWRDWVIHAFQTNKPYDRFLVEQLAGDLLPDRNDETLVATGFQRNSMITHEGGTIPEENLVNYGVDRVKTFGEAVLGLTLACAQCHDHKFDPLTQEDYYSLFAYFNQTSEPAHGGDGGINPDPVARLGSVLVTGEEEALRARIARLEQELAHVEPAALAQWEDAERAARDGRGEGLALHPVQLLAISTPNAGSGFSIEDARFARIEQPMGFVAFDVSMQFEPQTEPVTGLRIVLHADPAAPDAGWGWGGDEVGASGAKKSFAITDVAVSAGTTPADQVNLYRLLPLRAATASSWRGDDRPEGVLDTRIEAAWIPDIAQEGPAHLTLTFAEPLARETTHLTVQVNFGRHGSPTAKRMEFFLVSGVDDGSPLPPHFDALVARGPQERTDEDALELANYFAAHAPAKARVRVDLANARERLAARTEAFDTMVMDTAASPRETFVLGRGNYADPRQKVEARTPTVLPPLPPDAPRDRLGLAQWVVASENPLTARVAVNRFWQLFFGTGIVKSASDFGTQGEWPSHPELLDWLACEFVDAGWDVRHVVRLIVTSATYQQSSAASDAALAQDPHNRLLARGPRGRLPAELVRDTALELGGLLVDDIGGPSVNPYTPGDPWREISHFGSSPATAQSFVQDHGDKLYRRSLYTFWKRTLPPPSLALFDAPNRETCTFERASTNTPLQALVLLNDVQFVEAARGFAERILQRPGDDEERIVWAFTSATARVPDEREVGVLARALERERTHYTADESAAFELLSLGESLRDESIPVAEHAAWTRVAALLLNLSETVTKN